MFSKFAAIAALILSVGVPSLAHANSPLGTVNFCSGIKDGNYDFSAIQIALQAKGVLKINIINTAGSLENLAKLDAGECDVAIVQSDANNAYLRTNSHSSLNIERARNLYQEYVHFICNPASGITDVSKLTKDTVLLIGANGGGTAVTWDNFKAANPKLYGDVQTLPIGSVRAASKVQEGTDAQCMMYVAGLKSGAINDVNKIALSSDGKLLLMTAADSGVLGTKDPKGKPVYTKVTVPGGTYPGGLQPSAWFGSGVDTIAVDAILVANSNFIDAHETDYNNFLKAANNAMPSINQRVKPQ